uniref:Uncharacterized protein n=1 Tax=Arundo donax TaxID=35708 RepID=A0A0A9A344_ARUDO
MGHALWPKGWHYFIPMRSRPEHHPFLPIPEHRLHQHPYSDPKV